MLGYKHITTYQARDSSCGCSNSGDYLSGNTLGLQSVSWLNIIHFGSQVGSCCDEVDMFIAVVIFLK